MAIKPTESVLIPGTVAHIIYQLLNEKETLVDQVRKSTRLRDLLLKSIHDGLIVINPAGEITYVNRSEEHTSELQSRGHLVCRLLLEKKKTMICTQTIISP